MYLDNAATSHPKPEAVYAAMDDFMRNVSANPGRSGHSKSIEAARIVFEAREELAGLFGVRSSERVVFTNNATHAINLALKGLLKPGDNVVISSMEHNSVIRPLRFLEKEIGISITIAECDKEGRLSPQKMADAIIPSTKLVAILHASNVTGTIMPIREIGKVCRDKGVRFLVDAAQTAGVLPINMKEDNIDLLAFTGHKSLLGPQGIGGLCVGEGVELKGLVQGGTGSRSEKEVHPGFLPDALEAGTLNTVGIAGLLAGVRYIKEKGLDNIRKHESELMKILLDGLQKIDGITLYGPANAEDRVGVLSFNIAGKTPSEIGEKLDREYGIMVRVGLHCAPLAHKTIGSFPQGTVRVSAGAMTEEDEVGRLMQVIVN
ncbi:MAG: aminotransferase class V-fold PLP-dependent enzyme [Candidatus Margulisiibacteriota bacterium]